MCSIKLQAGLYFANSWTKFDRELGPGQDMRLHSWFNGWNGKSSTNKKDVENLVKSLLYSFNNIYQQQHFPEVLSVRLCGQATAGIITWSYNDSRIKMSHHLSRLNKLAKQDKSTNILTHFVCVITVLLQVCFNTHSYYSVVISLRKYLCLVKATSEPLCIVQRLTHSLFPDFRRVSTVDQETWQSIIANNAIIYKHQRYSLIHATACLHTLYWI